MGEAFPVRPDGLAPASGGAQVVPATPKDRVRSLGVGLRRSWVVVRGMGHVMVFPQVFHTRSLLCLVEEEPPVSTTLPVWLTSRACWAPDETARLMVTHRNAHGMQLVITTYELGTKRSREGVDVVGKDPRARTVTVVLWCFKHRLLRFPSGPFSSLSVSTAAQQLFCRL